MDAPEISYRPLGRLFVEKGLLTELRLEHALEEQARTGGRLGEKLVSLGYVTSTALARLLGEQYGVELDVDTGFGTGLRAELERRLDTPGAAKNQSALKLVEPLPPETSHPSFDEQFSALAGLEEQWAKLAAADARIAELEKELEAMRRGSAQREAYVASLTKQLSERDGELAKHATAAPRTTAKKPRRDS